VWGPGPEKWLRQCSCAGKEPGDEMIAALGLAARLHGDLIYDLFCYVGAKGAGKGRENVVCGVASLSL
jgi:hypothetical protein